MLVVYRNLLGESHPAAGERPEGMLGGLQWACRGRPGRSPAQRVSRHVIGEVVEGFSQRPASACTTICFSVFIAAVRAFTAVSRVILSWRIISTAPSAVFGDGRRLTRQYGPRGDLRVDGVGLAGGASRAPVGPIHFYDPMPRAAHRARARPAP